MERAVKKGKVKPSLEAKWAQCSHLRLGKSAQGKVMA